MQQKYLNTEKFNAENIAKELYDMTKLGGTTVTDFIPLETRLMLLEEIKKSKEYLLDAPKQEGKVYQEMKTIYFSNPKKVREMLFFPSISKICDEYSVSYKELEKYGNYETKPEINSIGVHYYYAGSKGISPHQDYAYDINLISIFVLQGEAPFYICKDRDKNGSIKLESAPGTLILMRGARNKTEQKLRPFHYIDRIPEDRYTLIFRQKVSKDG